MSRRRKYKASCPEVGCDYKVKTNWPIGPSGVDERMLRHKIEKHGYVPTEKEQKKLSTT